MLSAHPLPVDGPTLLHPQPSYGAFPPGSRPRHNVVGPSIASGWANIAMSSAEASSFSTRLLAETQCCRPIRGQRMGRHRYVLGRAMEPFHQALSRDAMLSAHPLLADGPTSLGPRPRHQAFPQGSWPRRNVVGPFVASGWADIATSSAELWSLSTRLSAETQCCRPIRCQQMGQHRYVLGRGIKPFHQALGRDAMLSAHPLLADGPTSLCPRPRHQAFPQGSWPRRNVVGPFVASGWADIATSSAEASSFSTRLSGQDAMLSAHPLPADGPTSLRPSTRLSAESLCRQPTHGQRMGILIT